MVYSFYVANYALGSSVLATTDTVNGNFTYTYEIVN